MAIDRYREEPSRLEEVAKPCVGRRTTATTTAKISEEGSKSLRISALGDREVSQAEWAPGRKRERRGGAGNEDDSCCACEHFSSFHTLRLILLTSDCSSNQRAPWGVTRRRRTVWTGGPRCEPRGKAHKFDARPRATKRSLSKRSNQKLRLRRRLRPLGRGPLLESESRSSLGWAGALGLADLCS